MGTIDRLTSMVADLITGFQEDQFSKIVSHYDFPLALHLEDRFVLLTCPADLERYLNDFKVAARAAEFASIRSKIMAVDLPRRGRFRAWVHYTHLDADGREVAQSQRIFFCRDSGDRIIVEMLELTKLPVQSLREWVPLQRMIA